MSDHPFLSPEFHIAWSALTADKVEADITAALNEANKRIEALCLLKPEEMNYDSVFDALESSTEELDRGWGRLVHLDSVCDNESQREAITRMMPLVVDFSSSIALNSRLWAVVKNAEEIIDRQTLTPCQKRFIEETLQDFRQSGADLPEESKKRIAEINTELSKLTKNYSEYVLDSTNAWNLVVEDEGMLTGLPQSAKDAALASAQSKGLGSPEKPVWRFTLHFPSMAPVMQFAENEDLRKQVWMGANEIGTGKYDTEPLIWPVLKLRDEKAKLLGFKNHADYTTSRRMAGTGRNALDFVENLHDKVVAPYRNEMEELRLFKEKKTRGTVNLLAPWEVPYWSEVQRKDLYDIDEEELRPYFSVEKVMEGMFDLVSTIFQISVTEKSTEWKEPGSAAELPAGTVEVWHPEVRFFEVHDRRTGEHLGSFYADWHPRDSKRGGAWMNQLEVGLPPCKGNRNRNPHLGLMCGNMTKPLGDRPALLTHREVETIFHEFGHLLHLMLSDVDIRSLAGTQVAWDFVELPSQIMENWCWERESVDRFARHFETGETIPDTLFDKMVKARNYQSAVAFMRQLTFGKLDLELHINLNKYLGKSIDEVDEEILTDYHVKLSQKAPSMAHRFTHIFGDPVGYSAGYYSYKWAEVLDADAFTRFQDEGIMNPDTGMDFREQILSKGNSLPAAELYRNFMRRDPELSALLERSGIPVA